MLAPVLFSTSVTVMLVSTLAMARLPKPPRVSWTWAGLLAAGGAGTLTGAVLLAAGLRERPTWNLWWAGLLVWAFVAFAAGCWQALRTLSH